MNHFLYENHWDSPTLTLLNVLGVLGVPNVLNVLNVLGMLNIPKDASSSCWASFLRCKDIHSDVFFFVFPFRKKKRGETKK